MDHEIALINAFIVPRKRRRLRDFLQKPRYRPKILKILHHFGDINPRFVVDIAPSDQNEQTIKELLLQRGAPANCHIISTDREIDGQDLPLDEAITRIFANLQRTLVSCIPGRLGYFEGEDPKNRFILEQAKPGTIRK